MKFNFKVFFSGLLVMFLVFTFLNFQAVRAQTVNQPEEPETVLMATVNIFNPESKKTGSVSYSISFQIHNRVGVQPDIRYGISLIDTESQVTVDLQLVNEAITLGEDEGIDVTLDYTIPSFIPDGVYRLEITAQNQNGLLLATSPISYPKKNIAIKNSNTEVSLDNCVLNVEREDSGLSFSNDQDTSVNPREKLKATCNISNKTSKDGNWRLQLVTHKRTQFGNIVANNILDQEMLIQKNTTKTISFYLPIQENPQAYSIDTFLIDNKGKKISRSVYMYYVMTGASATIENAILDKLSYMKGDIAAIRFLWVGSEYILSGDSSEVMRDSYSIKADIRNSADEICGSATKHNLSPLLLGNDLLEVEIGIDCTNPKVELYILSSEGSILDSAKIDSENTYSKVNINANIPYDKNISSAAMLYSVIFIVVLALISYGILYLRKEKIGNNH